MPEADAKYPEVPDELDALATDVVDAAAKVRAVLGAGLLEIAYQTAFEHELVLRGHVVRAQVPVSVVYEGAVMERAFVVDLLVDDALVVELKAVAELHPVHHAQTLTYLRWTGKRLGLLVNFHAVPFRTGIKRFVRSG